MVADVRGPGLLAGRQPCRMSRGTLRRICGKIVRANAYAQVRGMSADICKTVGSAYVGSNPTPATHFRRSEPVTLDCVTGFWRERERLRKPSAVSRGLCVGRRRPSPDLGRYRLSCRLICGNTSDGECLHAVLRAGRARWPWAVRGSGDWFTYIWRTGSGVVPTVRIAARFRA